MSSSSDKTAQRRLAAVLAADVVGYSDLMSKDEEGTLARLRDLRRKVIEPKIGSHHGRLVKTIGDGFLCEFSSPVEAVRCAVDLQEAVSRASGGEHPKPLQLRIGINLGDIIVEDDGDIFGDGVNIASRLQKMALPGGICLSGKVHEEVRDKLPYPFEDHGEHRFKNIGRLVKVYCLLAGLDPSVLPSEARSAASLLGKPSIAVLPFVNLSKDPDQEYFADGIVEDIIAALSRFRSFFVIARNSTFAYKGRNVSVQQIGRELGVRYVLEGSVRRSGEKIRITAQLVDAISGMHLWAEHYDGVIADVFDLQDQITTSVVGSIQPSIRAAEIERARRKRPENLDAYDLVMRALPYVWALEFEANREATRLIDKALLLDPGYSLALSLAAWCHGQKIVYNWSKSVPEDKRETLRLAQAAAAIAHDDPFILTVLGAALTITREYQRAGSMLERALALDPNSAWAWNRSGWLHNYQHDPEVAILHFERSLRLSPFDPMAFNCDVGIGCAHFIAKRYDQAALWQEKGWRAKPSATWVHRTLAPSYALAGDLERARESVGELVKHYPGISISAIIEAMAFSQETMARFAEGLRLAGLPE
ncbi:adenylate/guanylate cyclase domain-containing protein [Microvirga sp. CF3016]|uniref:adenylate/guanylate cyclase domain-containing protein n=1 Tax=Microvirga sp. CF3016 TaxID=3110181 RepID=UPI002E78E3F0|nr:adenylate/guanylate cyclase domain-containing protein [Microvirga sp. CF3016]MEE1611625.1 adenylate/guanylate cyclase domain-containing protein [Microvirga sp. CF3016]